MTDWVGIETGSAVDCLFEALLDRVESDNPSCQHAYLGVTRGPCSRTPGKLLAIRG